MPARYARYGKGVVYWTTVAIGAASSAACAALTWGTPASLLAALALAAFSFIYFSIADHRCAISMGMQKIYGFGRELYFFARANRGGVAVRLNLLGLGRGRPHDKS